MAPPPTPTSLMGLPASWRLKLATHKVPYDKGRTAVSLFSTCAFFRDTVLQHRTAVAEFVVPIAEERFPAELARLCAVARRSSNVKLVFSGSPSEDWTHTEPHITHLLVCAMAELGGPLTCVKEVHTYDLHQTALVPAWLKVCCPDVKKLQLCSFTLTPHPLDLPLAPPGSSTRRSTAPSPLTCQHLQSIYFCHDGSACTMQQQQHIRQQLAALPSLTCLATESYDWMLEPAVVSATLTLLVLQEYANAQHVAHLAVQFPNLRELDASKVTVDDDAVEALFRLPHLERLTVRGFDLQRSHTHRTWAVHLTVDTPDVEALARLPLEGVQTCTAAGALRVAPGSSVQAVARVVEAVGRWGGLGTRGRGWVLVDDWPSAAQLTTLGPLLAALPAEQRRGVVVADTQDMPPCWFRALGQQLPGSVATLQLWECTLQPEAWPALLPSLPASIKLLQVEFRPPATEEQLVALCVGAVRRVRVEVWLLSAGTLKRVEGRLVGLGREQLVTLVQW